MSILSRLFTSAPKPAPVLSPMVRGIIDSMVNHATDWSKEGDEFVHAPTGLTIALGGDELEVWTEYKLSEGYTLQATQDEYDALDRAYHTYLVKPTKEREQAARLKGGTVRRGHDDWDCADDLASSGLIKIKGTGVNPTWAMTELGSAICGSIRKHKAAGGTWATFTP